jgi:hypothetical protein
MDSRWTAAAITLTIALAAVAGGCDSTKTETGYTPRRVGMSNAELRTLYAPAFSPEAHSDERKTDIGVHRPGS